MSSDERESQAGSVSAGLDWSMISSDSGTEGMYPSTYTGISNYRIAEN